MQNPTVSKHTFTPPAKTHIAVHDPAQRAGNAWPAPRAAARSNAVKRASAAHSPQVGLLMNTLVPFMNFAMKAEPTRRAPVPESAWMQATRPWVQMRPGVGGAVEF